MLKFTKLAGLIIAAAMAVCGPGSQAIAQDYPAKSIDLVIPFAPGGGADRWGRTLAAEAETYFGQSMQPVNVTGAQGVTGWRHLLDQPADGYTILLGSGSTNLALALNPSTLVDPSDIKIVSIISAFQTVLLAKPDQPWSTWEGFVDYVKEHPNELTIGGSLGNLVSLASLMDQAGLSVRFVPYSGAGEATTDFLGDHVDLVGVVGETATKLVPSEASAVIISSNTPVPSDVLADVPTAASLGFEGMDTTRWIGVHPDTPEDVVKVIAEDLEALLDDPKVKTPLEASGERVYFTPTEQARTEYDAMLDRLEKAAPLLQ